LKLITSNTTSESHGSYYYGHTHDLDKRLSQHNKGQVRYTKSKRPWIIHYFEIYPTKSEAAKREYFFKSIEGYQWLKKEKIT
jgi:putative endonuclease